MHPQSELIDLTHSPSRPAYNDGRGVYEVARPRAAPDHISGPARQALMRDPRGMYREVIGPESPRAYVSEFDRTPILQNRQPAPALDHTPVNRPTTQYETRESPYMRSNATHGYYTTH